MTNKIINDIKQAEVVKIKNIIIKNSRKYIDYDEECLFNSDRIVDPDYLAEKLYRAGCRFTVTKPTL